MLTMREAVTPRCPDCRSIDWFRNGCVIAVFDGDVDLECGRFQRPDPALASATWSCNQCAYEVAPGSALERDLDAIRSRTCRDTTVA
ncbi:MAG: hypothetical protein ACJ765_07860 [Chloroflexota bacterium]